MNRTIAFVALALMTAAGAALTETTPTTIQRTGTCTVSNWPTDAQGNLKVAENGQPTVQVGNFPATQAVSGTVNVGNLPVDANGAVPVAQARRSPFVYTFGPLTLPANVDTVVTGPIDVDGYNILGIHVVASDACPSTGARPTAYAEWEWSPPVGFVPHASKDVRQGQQMATWADGSGPAFVSVQGGRFRLRMTPQCNAPLNVQMVAVQLRDE